MEIFLLRVGTSKKLYPKPAYIFGINHYMPIEMGKEEYSKRLLYFYKYGNEIEFFVQKLVDLFNLRFAGDNIKFDYVTLYPSHKKGHINANMENLVAKFSKLTGLPYKQILRRNTDIRPSHNLKTFEERKENLKSSIEILEVVTGKNVIVLDNTATTGMSLIDVTNLLIEKGAKNVVCICLGLGYKGKDNDWGDLNKTLKYSKIINVCKGPYVPKEVYEEWKKKN